MALRFIDSFDHYVTADIQTKWTSNSSCTIAAAGRNGTSCLEWTNFTRLVSKTIDAQATWIVGFAFRLSSYPTTFANGQFLAFLDSATPHVDFRIGPAGTIQTTRNGTVLGTGTIVLSLDTWYYLEFKVTISDTVGVVVTKVNGITDLNLSAQDTRNAGNASANVIQLGNGNAASTGRVDDFYACDGTGGAPANDFLGDVRVEALFPNGNGNSSQLVGSDGNSVDNYLLVDETAPATADYVESSTVGDKDTYPYTNLTSTAGTVYGVQVLPYAAKTDAGARSIVSVARLSATEVDSAVKALSVTPGYLPDVREAKPGGGAWAIADVNNAEFGAKVNA